MPVEDAEYLKMLKRMIRAGARRVGDADEIELRTFSELQKYFDLQMKEAVHSQITNGKSWADIGRAFGVSKQAAYRRFAKP